MENLIEIGSVPGIAAIVYAMIELWGQNLAKTWKPPVAGVLAVLWALAAFVLVDAFPNALAAIAAGVFAGSMAISGAALVKNYGKQPPAAG